jgi:hypothetical protein
MVEKATRIVDILHYSSAEKIHQTVDVTQPHKVASNNPPLFFIKFLL